MAVAAACLAIGFAAGASPPSVFSPARLAARVAAALFSNGFGTRISAAFDAAAPIISGLRVCGVVFWCRIPLIITISGSVGCWAAGWVAAAAGCAVAAGAAVTACMGWACPFGVLISARVAGGAIGF